MEMGLSLPVDTHKYKNFEDPSWRLLRLGPQQPSTTSMARHSWGDVEHQYRALKFYKKKSQPIQKIGEQQLYRNFSCNFKTVTLN